MKRIQFVILTVLACVFTHAQTLSITDHESEEPLDMVSIFSASPRAFSMTNADGQADISAFVNAEFIEIRNVGYRTIVVSFEDLKRLNFELHLEISSLHMPEVIIAASRWQQTSDDIPQNVISISPKQVALQNPQTVADLLGISGKIFIQKSQQGGGSPMIRGFATNRLLYIVDGVRMNTAIFRGGNIQNVISLDAFAIEHTEVLFGPGSVMYGSDAIGGVMNFQTLTPQFTLNDDILIAGKADGRYSSINNERTTHFDVNVGGKKWAFLSSFTSSDFDDLRMGSNGPDDYLKPYLVMHQDSMDVVANNPDPRIQSPSAYSQINMMQKVRFQPNEKWDFQYGVHYSETSEYGRYDRHNRLRNNLPRYGEWNYGPQIWLMNNLNVTHKTKNKLYDQFTLRFANQQFEESRISRNLNSTNREIRTEEVAANSINLDLIKEIGKRNTLLYGVEYVHNAVNSSGQDQNINTGEMVKVGSRYPNSTWQSMGVYLSNQFKISPKYSLHAGIRYNHFILDANFDTSLNPFPFTTANVNDGALTGSLGLVYHPSKTWLISINAATAFRSPNVDDIGKIFDSEPGAVVVPNPNLEAEYAYSGDFEISKIINEFLKFNISAYYTILQNAMVRRDFLLDGKDSILYSDVLSKVQAIQNAAVAKVYGIQAGIEMAFGANFSFTSDFNFQKGEDELDDGSISPSRHAAPSFGVSRLIYKNKNITLQVNSIYQAQRSFNNLAQEEQGKTEIYALDELGRPYSPAWYTINFKAMYKFSPQFSVAAGLENITDQRYRPYSSGLSGAGRNMVVSVRTTF